MTPTEHRDASAARSVVVASSCVVLSCLLSSLVLTSCGSRTGILDDGVDAGRDAGADAGADACVEFPSVREVLCELDGPNASVRGETPFGYLEFEFAWAGYLAACSGDSLVLGQDEFLSGLQPTLPILYLSDLPSPGTSGEADVYLSAPGCRQASTIGQIEVLAAPESPGDDPRGMAGAADGFCACDGNDREECVITGERQYIVARIRVSGEGWDLEGEIRAPQCHLLHGICF